MSQQGIPDKRKACFNATSFDIEKDQVLHQLNGFLKSNYLSAPQESDASTTACFNANRTVARGVCSSGMWS
jgi:hypothetical protein